MTLFLVAAQDRADSPFNRLADPSEVFRALTALDDELRAAGVLIFSRGLQPPDAAVTFRVEDGGGSGWVTIGASDGPYGPTTLAGMWILDCGDEDEARTWAARCAATHQCDVELRPFQPHVSEYLAGQG